MVEKLENLKRVIELTEEKVGLETVTELINEARNNDKELVLGVVLDDIETNPDWNREDIIDYVKGYGIESVG